MPRYWFRQLLDFTLFSNLYIAACAIAQGALTYLLIGEKPDSVILSILGCATLFLYNFSMILSRPKDPTISPYRRVHWIYSHFKLVNALTISAACALIVLAFQLSTNLLFLLAGIGLIALSYNFPFVRKAEKRSGLRNIPGAKLFIIALVWALSCVCVPILDLLNRGILIDWQDIVLLTFKRFLFIAAITIPFDLRDLFQDKGNNLKTIPVLLGERNAKLFCQLLLALYIVLLLGFTGQLSLPTIGLICTTVFTGWLIFKSGWKKDEYFYFLYLDGTLILQLVSVLLLNLL